MAGVATAAPAAPPQFNNGTIAVFNNCPQEVHTWTYKFPKAEGSEMMGIASQGFKTLNSSILEHNTGGIHHISTSPDGYADHNTRQFLYATRITDQSLILHTKLQNAFGNA